ncbi:MAG: hypothetical protein FJX72_00945, partial [Armatimonadetes bacterium]|nr:hypothetical protein [Armatimonadota bacterium]
MEHRDETALNMPEAHTSRRAFIARAVAAGLTSACATPGGGQAPVPAALPKVTIAGVTIPRMIVGCNPIGGWSHMSRYMTMAMTEYFTLERTVEFLGRCEGLGLNVWITYWDDKPRKALRALWEKGSKLRPYFLGTLEESGSISKDVLDFKPIWHVHHGNATDTLFRSGQHEKVHDFVKKVHDVLGIPAGISAHNPDCIK